MVDLEVTAEVLYAVVNVLLVLLEVPLIVSNPVVVLTFVDALVSKVVVKVVVELLEVSVDRLVL